MRFSSSLEDCTAAGLLSAVRPLQGVPGVLDKASSLTPGCLSRAERKRTNVEYLLLLITFDGRLRSESDRPYR
jgi:hypothetical protein